jgi:hypothetical protein
MKSFLLFGLVFLPAQLLLGQQTEVLGKSATVKLAANLEIFSPTPATTGIWVKRAPLEGDLTLKAGSGLNARHEYQQLLDMYKASYSPVKVLAHSQRGNTFRIETTTGSQSYDIRQLIYATYVPQEPRMPQKSYMAVVRIANMSWNSNGGKALRAALETFKPKASVFKDKEAPKLFMGGDSATSWDASYTLKGVAWDNVTATLLQVSVKSPLASGFGKWQDVRLGGSGKSKQWTHRLPMQAAKGPWKIQLRLKDAAGNTSKIEKFTITRR